MLYLADGERLIVIGSNAGHEKAPAWSLNLEANPDAEVELASERQKVRARIAAGEEREELWRKMNVQYGGFDDYSASTTREIRAVRAGAALAGGPLARNQYLGAARAR